MKFSRAIDEFITDWQTQGRMNSPRSEVAYRATLQLLADQVSNRDPRTIGRDDIKRLLRRWPNPNTQYTRRAHLVAFFTWAMEEGHRKDNPAQQTRRPRRQKPQVYRLTRAEASAMLTACETIRERRVIHIGICAGLRLSELRGLQARHFERPGFIWVSPDIAKGGRQRWVPVIPDLEPTVTEILGSVGPGEFVIPAERWRNPGLNTVRTTLALRPASVQVVRTCVMTVAKRAGISAHVHPHLMRHAFGDLIARYAGLKHAQFLLGHADVGTTESVYTGAPTLDELARAVAGFAFHPTSTAGTPLEMAHSSNEASTGIEPVDQASRPDTQDFPFDSPELRAKIAMYVAHYEGAPA